MSWLCRLGWHWWGHWQPVKVITTNYYNGIKLHDTDHMEQRRECHTCGKQQQVRV